MWWNDMSTLQQVMFIVACSATAILVLQIILMLIGSGSDADFSADGTDFSADGISDATDMDFDGDVPDGGSPADAGDGIGAVFGMRLLSLRSIIAFIAVGSWTCYTLCYPLEWYVALIIAAVCGLAAACAMAGIMIGMERMQSSGNIDPNNAVGKIGTVYLTVPPSRTGRGKVNIIVQERYTEYEAITNGDTALPTTTEIKVTGYAGDNVLIVEKYKKPSITVTTE